MRCELLDEKDREPLCIEVVQDRHELLDDFGGKAERDLVDHQEIGFGDETAGDGQHLLLAPRKAAGELMPPLAQPRELRVEPLEILANGAALTPPPAIGAKNHVILDGLV